MEADQHRMVVRRHGQSWHGGDTHAGFYQIDHGHHVAHLAISDRQLEAKFIDLAKRVIPTRKHTA